jgi:hypothetical protein
MVKAEGGTPSLETISKMKNAAKLTIVGSMRAPDRFNTSTKSTASFGHVFCADNTRATGSCGAGVARFFGTQAAS